LALAVPLSRFTSQVGGGSAFFVRPKLCAMHGVHSHTMKKIITLLFVSTLAVSALAADVSYSTEASITPGKDKRQCQIVVRISQISEQDGKATETLIAQPRSLTNLGQKASFFVGNDDPKTQCVSVDVFSPKTASDFASCVVTVTRGGQVLSKSATKLKMYVQ